MPKSPSRGAHVAYHRLLIRSHILTVRVTALQCAIFLVSPIATPLLVGAMHRWSDRVASDVTALGMAVRGLRARVAAERNAQAMPRFQNPWL